MTSSPLLRALVLSVPLSTLPPAVSSLQAQNSAKVEACIKEGDFNIKSIFDRYIKDCNVYIQNGLNISQREVKKMAENIRLRYPSTEYTFIILDEENYNQDEAVIKSRIQQNVNSKGQRNVFIAFVVPSTQKPLRVIIDTSGEYSRLQIEKDLPNILPSERYSALKGNKNISEMMNYVAGKLEDAYQSRSHSVDTKPKTTQERPSSGTKQPERKASEDDTNSNILKWLSLLGLGAGAGTANFFARKKKKEFLEIYDKEKKVLDDTFMQFVSEMQKESEFLELLYGSRSGKTEKSIEKLQRAMQELGVLLTKISMVLNEANSIANPGKFSQAQNIVYGGNFEKALDFLNGKQTIDFENGQIDASLQEILLGKTTQSFKTMRERQVKVSLSLEEMKIAADKRIETIRAVLSDFVSMKNIESEKSELESIFGYFSNFFAGSVGEKIKTEIETKYKQDPIGTVEYIKMLKKEFLHLQNKWEEVNSLEEQKKNLQLKFTENSWDFSQVTKTFHSLQEALKTFLESQYSVELYDEILHNIENYIKLIEAIDEIVGGQKENLDSFNIYNAPEQQQRINQASTVLESIISQYDIDSLAPTQKQKEEENDGKVSNNSEEIKSLQNARKKWIDMIKPFLEKGKIIEAAEALRKAKFANSQIESRIKEIFNTAQSVESQVIENEKLFQSVDTHIEQLQQQEESITQAFVEELQKLLKQKPQAIDTTKRYNPYQRYQDLSAFLERIRQLEVKKSQDKKMYQSIQRDLQELSLSLEEFKSDIDTLLQDEIQDTQEERTQSKKVNVYERRFQELQDTFKQKTKTYEEISSILGKLQQDISDSGYTLDVVSQEREQAKAILDNFQIRSNEYLAHEGIAGILRNISLQAEYNRLYNQYIRGEFDTIIASESSLNDLFDRIQEAIDEREQAEERGRESKRRSEEREERQSSQRGRSRREVIEQEPEEEPEEVQSSNEDEDQGPQEIGGDDDGESDNTGPQEV